jgi:uncharacterized membrane protein (UPF0182 family)
MRALETKKVAKASRIAMTDHHVAIGLRIAAMIVQIAVEIVAVVTEGLTEAEIEVVETDSDAEAVAAVAVVVAAEAAGVEVVAEAVAVEVAAVTAAIDANVILFLMNAESGAIRDPFSDGPFCPLNAKSDL